MIVPLTLRQTEHANISFEVVSTEDADIRVTFNEGIVFSYVGTASRGVSQDKKTMNLQLHSNSFEENFARAVLHGFGLAIGLKHVHQVTPSHIPWDFDALYSYYEENQNWSKAQVKLNVLDLLAADTLTSPDGDSVMLYSIPKDLTSNEVSIQGQGALTATDIALASGLIPFWNDLNVSLVPTKHSGDPWQNLPKGGVYQLKQAISPPASAVPKVAAAFASIYTIGDPHLRAYSLINAVTPSNIDVTIATWNQSQLLQGTLSTFWAAPKSPNPIFQTGIYHSEKGQAINQRIKFEIPYKTRPKVFVGLSEIDLDGTYDFDATVVSADKEGFYLNITSPGGLHSASVSWVAWPGNHPGVETGTFYLGPVTKSDKAYTIKGSTEFDTVFDRQPKVHFALSSFQINVAGAGEFWITLTADATKTALNWSASTWLTLGRVRGNYLVFQV